MKKHLTNEEAYQILTEHTRNYVSLCDIDALEIAIQALEEKINASKGGKDEE